MPPQGLQPLLGALPRLSEEDFRACVRAAALHLRGDEDQIDSAGLAGRLSGAGVSKRDQRRVLEGCAEVVRGAAAASALKVASRLGKVGFDESQVAAVLSAAELSRAPAAGNAPPPKDADGSHGASSSGAVLVASYADAARARRQAAEAAAAAVRLAACGPCRFTLAASAVICAPHRAAQVAGAALRGAAAEREAVAARTRREVEAEAEAR
jgi:hypothetical protein